MKRILVTMRTTVVESYNERRDSIDQRWANFLCECGLLPIFAPNNPALLVSLLQTIKPDGVLFTGGDDLVRYSGGAPERDEVETILYQLCITEGIPLLGVCRGMQIIAKYFG